ncbi:hypothetical protein IW262DRAFT_1425110 [Armillaria fumosa]|nr:hypothetical protein IW262DRAFT_1425110 [Armillaria fumosa]
MDLVKTFVELWRRWWKLRKRLISRWWQQKIISVSPSWHRTVHDFFKHPRAYWPHYEGTIVTKSPPIASSWSHDTPEFILSAFVETGQAESTIPVVKQRSYTTNEQESLPAIALLRHRVISSALANTGCAELGIDGVLEKLNVILGTSHTLGSKILRSLGVIQLDSILEPYVTRNDDFGTIYAHLRPYWHFDADTIEQLLRTLEETTREVQRSVIVDDKITIANVAPRRVWDLCANRVVPSWIAAGVPCGISHAWVDEKDRVSVMTPINGYEWPVPMPKDANLDLIRIEMLNLIPHEYAWLDVLCLRQEGGKNEYLRLEEWKLDVPTIGAVYHHADTVACYFNGLGRPLHLTLSDFDSDRCWFRRAWTLQELPRFVYIAGKTDNDFMEERVQRRFEEQLALLREIRVSGMPFRFVSEMQNRVSTKPLDKVAGLVYLLKPEAIPIYDAEQSVEDAWEILMDVMRPDFRAQFLFYYPEPGNGRKRWRPSWEQVMRQKITEPYYSRSMFLAEVLRTEHTDRESFKGYHIDSGYVRGLSEMPTETKCRQGELIFKDANGAPHTIKIVADHAYPIPNGSYTLVAYRYPPHYMYAVGQVRRDGYFEKLSVFYSVDDEEVVFSKLGFDHRAQTFLC